MLPVFIEKWNLFVFHLPLSVRTFYFILHVIFFFIYIPEPGLLLLVFIHKSSRSLARKRPTLQLPRRGFHSRINLSLLYNLPHSHCVYIMIRSEIWVLPRCLTNALVLALFYCHLNEACIETPEILKDWMSLPQKLLPSA